jgi:hypothetical protein
VPAIKVNIMVAKTEESLASRGVEAAIKFANTAKNLTLSGGRMTGRTLIYVGKGVKDYSMIMTAYAADRSTQLFATVSALGLLASGITALQEEGYYSEAFKVSLAVTLLSGAGTVISHKISKAAKHQLDVASLH